MLVNHDEKAPIFYKATPTTEKHKVIENTKTNTKGSKEPNNGKPWWCPRLDQYFDTYTPRYILSVLAADSTGSQYLNCFDEWGKVILGCEAREIENMKLKDSSKFEYTFEDALFKKYMIKVKAVEDTYAEEKRLKCIAASIENIDYVKDSRILIEKINNLLNN